MPHPLLTRQSYRPKPALHFLGDLSLTRARVHEFCGPSRRMLALLVAAENGAQSKQGPPPLGLLLIAGEGGAPAVESRWHMAPKHHDEAQIWRLERRRARLEPEAAWHVQRQGRTCQLRPPA